ncbi:MAG TPA: putative toxin-antitoxin system toxin component, PIN family [Spirochaetota bacterium]|nr:putative toxin-antitoxin system toxin component, PIN family [Spirochaetota bacterium]HPI90492.1 putative toxin-antitoxin system toxin component, PIN family [Spirochaetota bacterium]HPR46936.1 putative toxin-antitoxin system toxin component, PIN family [Spirochaetota bacterium]
MKVVLDTNIIVAAYASRGLCNSLFELCLDRCSVIISDFILNEVKKTLAKKLKMPDTNVTTVIDFLKEFCILSSYSRLAESVCRDKSDNEILALAVSNNAEYIITGDNDLLVLREYNGIPIVNPRDFWGIVKNIK